ncbi:aromatic amino acid transporter AroP, partial [Xanthomonas citri pv. citri]|nr:aromatic amino acid transporter AroP [Xanthomonas citri pv. citri]
IINLTAVRAYGEFEFWFAVIKVVAILAMIVLGLLIIATGLGGGPPTGIGNLWRHGGFFPTGISGMLCGFVVVMFSFGG